MPTVKIHFLIPLSKPIMGVTHRVACQRSFKFSTGRQLRGTFDPNEVTCTKCLESKRVSGAGDDCPAHAHVNPLDPSTKVHTTAICGWCGRDVYVR